MNKTATPSPIETAHRYGPSRQKVPAFARFKGTSAWRKDRKRAHEYAIFLKASRAGQTGTTHA